MSTGGDFGFIRDAYYRAWFRFHPERAVELGVAGYADLLAPCGDEDVGALVALNEKLLSALEELPTADLSSDDTIDYRLMQGAAFLELSDLLENDWRVRDPQRFLPLNAIYQLTIHAVENFPEALRSRLQRIPAYLRDARQCLSMEPERIPPAWLESAVTEATAGIDYLANLPQQLVVRDYAKRLRGLPEWIADAQAALGEFAGFLETLGARAQGDHACGVRRFNDLLKYRHFLDIDVQALHAAGERLTAQAKRDLARVSSGLGSEPDRAIRARVPEASRLLNAYADAMRAARGFVVKRGLVTVPDDEALQVVETPPFMRHQIPFAAYDPPAPREPGQVGRYYVTPVTNAEALAEHNFRSIKHTCAHEAYPGHHVQFVVANRHAVASTLPRLANTSATLYEGWALYCEQLMWEQGFLEGAEHEYLLLKDRLWRALRVTIDVDLHTRGVTPENAARRLAEELGFPMEQARADISWYIRSPATPMGYATGWALIVAARDQARATGADDARGFHDALLSCGSIALPLVLERRFGGEFATRAVNTLFAKSAA